MDNGGPIITQGDIMEALKPIIEDRIAWEKTILKDLTILKVDQEHHDGRIAKLEDLMSALPALTANVQRIVDVIEGSSRQSDVGALKRITALERDALTYTGISWVVAVISGSVAAVVGILTFVLQHPWR